MSRIYARDAALRVVEDGFRWVCGVEDVTDIDDFEKKLDLSAVHRAQVGVTTDLDYVADVLYERTAT
jgi:hypothetical protein